MWSQRNTHYKTERRLIRQEEVVQVQQAPEEEKVESDGSLPFLDVYGDEQQLKDLRTYLDLRMETEAKTKAKLSVSVGLDGLMLSPADVQDLINLVMGEGNVEVSHQNNQIVIKGNNQQKASQVLVAIISKLKEVNLPEYFEEKVKMITDEGYKANLYTLSNTS